MGLKQGRPDDAASAVDRDAGGTGEETAAPRERRPLWIPLLRSGIDERDEVLGQAGQSQSSLECTSVAVCAGAGNGLRNVKLSAEGP